MKDGVSQFDRILLTANQEPGGLQSFAEALRAGFEELGLAAEIVLPSQLLQCGKKMRDSSVLKILSTSAVFSAPCADKAICVAHGFPRPDAQGWPKTLAILSSLKLANLTGNCQLVAVSDYVAAHLRGVYKLRVDAVIRNPVLPIFEQTCTQPQQRSYLTYLGRLHPAKNIHKILPAMLRMLEEDPDLRICIIGDGPMREQIKALVADNARVEFYGFLPSAKVRQLLRRTRIFISGNEMEPFGITYLEALSQGCCVAMPACGGGLEIAPGLIGSQVQLFRLSFDPQDLLRCMRRALAFQDAVSVSMAGYGAAEVAAAYLRVASGNA